MDLNNIRNVHLHRQGLSDQDAQLPFYSIANGNSGLGTCSPVEQYDMPLKEIATVKVACGDAYLREQGIGPIDAIKIDVQGFEPEVLRGLRERLKSDRPYVWLEIGNGTLSKVDQIDALQELFPYPIRLKKFVMTARLTQYRVDLVDVQDNGLSHGDYVVVPRVDGH